MPDQKTIDLIGYVHTSNKSKMYEKNKELEEKKKLGYEVGRLQMKHSNDLLNQQTEMIKQELITMINEK